MQKRSYMMGALMIICILLGYFFYFWQGFIAVVFLNIVYLLAKFNQENFNIEMFFGALAVQIAFVLVGAVMRSFI